jgi:hypothetical protein
MAQYQVDHDGHDETHDLRPVGHLPAVHVAVPGGSSVNQLVAQHVQALEKYRDDLAGITAVLSMGRAGRMPSRPKPPSLKP